MTILTVTQINNQAKYALETNFNDIWVRGEVVNPKLYPSGHLYFTLKDENSEISVVFFSADKNSNSLRHGHRVVLSGHISLYASKGRFQFIVKNLYSEGEGELWREFEALKKRLESEGLFSESSKLKIPRFPAKVGLITSEQGAVLWDILHDFKQKQSGFKVVVRPSKVQGIDAVEDIIDALNDFEEFGNVDVIVLARGGGSQEDLWCFNHEKLARKIHECTIPIISAIGHETDFTIADFTADLRTPTPSYAAELLTRPFIEQRQSLDSTLFRLTHSIKIELNYQKNRLDQLNLSGRLNTLLREIKYKKNDIITLRRRLKYEIISGFNKYKSILEGMETQLKLHHPEQWLKRGFAHVTDLDDNTISSIKNLTIEQDMNMQFTDGKIQAKVTKMVNN